MTCLMKLWPTRVRTGVAAGLADRPRGRPWSRSGCRGPCRRGSGAGSPSATIAVVVEPDSAARRARRPGTPGRRRRRRRGRRRRRPRGRGPGGRARFSGWIGSAGWFGNVPSSSPYMTSRSNGSAVEHRRDDQAAHAVGGVGHDLQRVERGDVDERADVGGERRRAASSRGDRCRGVARPARRRPRPCRLIVARARCPRRRAGPRTRQNLMPLYCGRVVRRGEHRARARRASRRRSTAGRWRPSPRSTTSRPWDVTPSAKAADQLDARGPHVAGDQHPARPAGSSAGRSGRRRHRSRSAHVGVELVGHRAADVVGLEDRVESRRHAGGDPSASAGHGHPVGRGRSASAARRRPSTS